MQEKTQPLFAALERLERLHDQWSSGNGSGHADELPAKFLTACDDFTLALAEALDENGAPPPELSGLFLAAVRFLDARRHAEATTDSAGRSRLETVGPPQDMWSKFHHMVDARRNATLPPREPPPVDTVTSLRAQGLNDTQIAKAFGKRTTDASGMTLWTGVFFDERGAVLFSRISDQAKFEAGEKDGRQWIPADFGKEAPVTVADVDTDVILLEAIRVRQHRRRRQTSAA